MCSEFTGSIPASTAIPYTMCKSTTAQSFSQTSWAKISVLMPLLQICFRNSLFDNIGWKVGAEILILANQPNEFTRRKVCQGL